MDELAEATAVYKQAILTLPPHLTLPQMAHQMELFNRQLQQATELHHRSLSDMERTLAPSLVPTAPSSLQRLNAQIEELAGFVRQATEASYYLHETANSLQVRTPTELELEQAFGSLADFHKSCAQAMRTADRAREFAEYVECDTGRQMTEVELHLNNLDELTLDSQRDEDVVLQWKNVPPTDLRIQDTKSPQQSVLGGLYGPSNARELQAIRAEIDGLVKEREELEKNNGMLGEYSAKEAEPAVRVRKRHPDLRKDFNGNWTVKAKPTQPALVRQSRELNSNSVEELLKVIWQGPGEVDHQASGQMLTQVVEPMSELSHVNGQVNQKLRQHCVTHEKCPGGVFRVASSRGLSLVEQDDENMRPALLGTNTISVSGETARSIARRKAAPRLVWR